MPGLRRLFSCIGQAVLSAGPKALIGLVPFGEAIYDVAAEALKRLRQKPDAEVNAELAAAAQADAPAARQEAEAVVAELASGQTPEVQANLVSYLSLVPDAIRQSLRRPADPTGKTVPGGTSIQKPEQLLPFLPSRLPRFKPGDRPTPGGNWELVEMLGVGGFGEVWRAKHPQFDGIQAALKFCLDPKASELLRHEGAILNRIMRCGSHPGIVPLKQAQLQAEPCYLEYEYIDGGNLGKLIATMPTAAAARVASAASWIRNLAKTVGWFHQQSPPIVHRDLKPANILLHRTLLSDNKTIGVRLRIADFGIGGLAASRALEQTRAGSTTYGEFRMTSLRGSHTPLYASPQQARGESPDVRDDVHALGVIWYQLLTGDMGSGVGPDFRTDLTDMGVDDATISLLGQCVSAKPERRPQDAAILAAKLDELRLATAQPPTTATSGIAFETPALTAPPAPTSVQPSAAGRAIPAAPIIPPPLATSGSIQDSPNKLAPSTAGLSATASNQPPATASTSTDDEETEDDDELEEEEEEGDQAEQDDEDDEQPGALRKAQIFQELSAATKLTNVQVGRFYDKLTALIVRELAVGGPGIVQLPGLLNLRRVATVARPARKGRNPLTGEQIILGAKPAGVSVRARVLKAIKEAIADEGHPGAIHIGVPGRVSCKPKANQEAEWTFAADTPGAVTIEDGDIYVLVVNPSAEDEDLAGLANLVSMRSLVQIDLVKCRNITDAGLAHLGHLTSLECLLLKGLPQVSDAGLAQLASHPGLEWLELSGCRQVTDEAMQHLRGLHALKFLDLSGCRQITGAGFAQLAGLVSLQRFWLNGCTHLAEKSLAHLSKLGTLRSLLLDGCKQVTDAGLALLGRHGGLKYLSLSGCWQVTDDGLALMGGMASLEALDLSGCEQITDAGLAHLCKLKELKSVDVSDCPLVTETGMSPFTERHKLCFEQDWHDTCYHCGVSQDLYLGARRQPCIACGWTFTVEQNDDEVICDHCDRYNRLTEAERERQPSSCQCRHCGKEFHIEWE